VLVKAVQEQQAQIAELEQQNAALQARLAGNAPPATLNVFNLLTVIAFGGFVWMGWQQRRSKRGKS